MSYQLSKVDREYYEGVATNPLHRSVDRAIFVLLRSNAERELIIWTNVFSYAEPGMEAFKIIEEKIKSLLELLKKSELILTII